MVKTVLVVAGNTLLLSVRGMILREAGYEVAGCVGVFRGNRLIASLGYDLLLIGHSLPVVERRVLIIRSQRCSPSSIVEITSAESDPTGLADREVDMFEPENLVRAVSELLGPIGG